MGGRLLPNARGAYWFLKLRHPKKPTGISSPAQPEPRSWNPIGPEVPPNPRYRPKPYLRRRLPRPDPRKSQRSA